MTMYAGDEHYDDEITSPTERPLDLRPMHHPESRLASLERRVDDLDQQVDDLTSRLHHATTEIATLRELYHAVESQLDELESTARLTRDRQRGIVEAIIEALQQYQV